MRQSGFDFGMGACDHSCTPANERSPPPGVERIYHLLETSRVYLWFSIAATIFSLFAHDFSIAFLPKQLDDSVSGLLLAVFVLFVVEIGLNMYCKVSIRSDP
jgi:hypothetical protein